MKSKFGGLPYLKNPTDIPIDKNGKRMCFVAQINFEESPQLPHYPDKGILQFFVSEDNYGADYESDLLAENQIIKVIYIENPEIINSNSTTQEIPQLHEVYFAKEFKLEFEKSKEGITCSDYRLPKIITKELGEYADETFLYDDHNEYIKFNSGEEHKIGGYLFCAQLDPRVNSGNDTENEEYEVLLQIVSQYNEISKKHEIIWGDSGVGHFFIKPSDLQKKDFSKVTFSWDCF